MERPEQPTKRLNDSLHGSGATSSHEIALPTAGIIRLQLFLDDGVEVQSDASTRNIPQA